MDYSLSKLSSGGKRYIRCSEPVWKQGFKVSEKVGMLEIENGTDAENEAKLQMLATGEIGVKLGEVQNRLNGFYDVTVVFANEPATTATEEKTIEHQA